MAKNTAEKTKKKIGLSTQIFIALLIGALFGVVIHYWIPSSYIKDTVIVEGVLYVVGQGFIRLMQMLVVPLVFCSLICGSMAIGDTKTLGKVGVKTIGFYLVTTALAVCVALGSALLINPGLGLDMDAVQKGTVSSSTEATSLVDTLLNIIPKNPVQSMANGDMLPIIVFALFVGIMLAKLGTRGSVVANFFSQFNDVMMEMTMAIMKIAPIGVFCLIARTFATVGFSAFAPMLKYMGNVTLALAIQCLIVYQILLFVFTRLNQKVPAGYGICILHGNIQCDDPDVDRYAEQKNGCIQADFFLYDSAGCDHQHGWNLYHAGCCGSLYRAGVWYPAYDGKSGNRSGNGNACLHRYCWCTECWSGNSGDGTEFRRTSDRRYRPDHGYRPYPGYDPYRSQHHR